MTPYYQDDYVTIYHGDCVNIMPLLSPVDLMITDPPYGMMFRSNRRIIKHDRIVNDNYLPVEMIIAAIEKSTRASYVFCRWDNLFEMPLPKNVLVWVKNSWSMGDLKHEHGRQWEACCFYPKDDHVFSRRIPDVIEVPRTGNTYHPTEKPVDLMARLIDCNIGEIILDPFMGSGTTLRAAKDLRRKAVGIEIEECYCEIAAKRMAQEVLAL